MNGKAPDAFRTISEVAEWLGVNAHVLRFWESKFSQVKPVKRAGGRRYYRPSDMELLGGIQKLLHVDGMTIKGAQKVLREKGVKAVCAMSKPVEAPMPEPAVEEAPQESLDPSGAEVLPAEEPTSGSPEPVHSVSEPSEPEPEPEPPVEAKQDTVLPLFGQGEDESKGSEDAVPTSPMTHSGSSGTAPESEMEHDWVSATPPEPTTGPIIAPLPVSDRPLAETLSGLRPGQIDPSLLHPLYERLLQLRARFDSAR